MNENETIADILAEMRDFARPLRVGGDLCSNVALPATIGIWADRIEAAAKREYEEAKDYFAKLHDGPSMICTAKNCAVRNVGLSLDAPGNAAAMRKFDEAAFDQAVSKPNGWSDVADPVAEIRKMRDGDAPGNAAALRDALEKFLDFSRRGLAFFTSYRYTEAENEEIEAAFDEAKSALAAPARNCDLYATAEDAYAAWQKLPNLASAFAWLFAPAEGGKE